MRNLTGLLAVTLVLVIVLGAPGDLLAQCPMCKLSAETNLSNGGTAGAGLNAGILYLFATPYLVAAVIGYVWFRNRKRAGADEDAASLN